MEGKLFIGDEEIGIVTPVTMCAEECVSFGWEYYMRRGKWSYFRSELGMMKLSIHIPGLKYGEIVGINYSHE